MFFSDFETNCFTGIKKVYFLILVALSHSSEITYLIVVFNWYATDYILAFTDRGLNGFNNGFLRNFSEFLCLL